MEVGGGGTKGVPGLGVLDKGGVGRSVDEGSGQRVASLFYSDGSRKAVGERRAAKSVAGSGVEVEED